MLVATFGDIYAQITRSMYSLLLLCNPLQLIKTSSPVGLGGNVSSYYSYSSRPTSPGRD